jgi:D-3-phosphoglycerate dehydrogenase
MPRESVTAGVANANVPNMLGQISTAMANAGLNIHNMMNKSRGKWPTPWWMSIARCQEDRDRQIAKIEGVLAVRYLPLESLGWPTIPRNWESCATRSTRSMASCCA